jgi:hypothetical protein
MGFKLALNLGLEIGTTKLALSLAEKNLTYVNPLKEGGGLKFNAKFNVIKYSTKFKPLN